MRKSKLKEQTTLRDDFQRLQEACGGVPREGNVQCQCVSCVFPATCLSSWMLPSGQLDAYCHILLGRVLWKRHQHEIAGLVFESLFHIYFWFNSLFRFETVDACMTSFFRCGVDMNG